MSTEGRDILASYGLMILALILGAAIGAAVAAWL